METSAAVGQLDQVKRIQRVVRIINMICAGTGVGLIITFLLMNAQLVFGNGLNFPMVPKLEGPELIIVGILDLLIVLLIIVFLGIIVLIMDGIDSTGSTESGGAKKAPEALSPQNPVGGAVRTYTK